MRDLSAAGLDLCERLMLAQAQACYYEKAIAAEPRPPASVVARLAAHAAHLFWRARAACAAPADATDPKKLAELLLGDDDAAGDAAPDADATDPPAPDSRGKGLEGIDDSWAHHVEFQARCFEAAAAYWAAKGKADDAERTGEGYGAQAGRPRGNRRPS